MRTKLFLAFFAVISIALISNFIFENFMAKDFEEYVSSTKEDKLYWVLASVEGAYAGGRWDEKALHDAAHWGTMLGFDLKITDLSGHDIMTSKGVMDMLSSSMQRRMGGIVDIGSASGEYEPYPLYVEGQEIGTMFVRKLKRVGGISEKEALFRKRGKFFLAISFLIAGGGAVFLAIFFSLFLSQPLKRMKNAVESLAKGDFSVRIPTGNKQDEVGKLSDSFNFMADALEREEALRKHLTSNIAHELRTPLAIMKANVEAMIDGIVDDHGKGMENIQIEIEKLIRLVQGIEDITKAEASFFTGKDYSEINLRDFLSGNVSELNALAAGKGLEMKVVNDRQITVLTDRDKLEKIVQNVITNAIKNTESGGIQIDYGLEKQMFFIEVRDTGSGIPDDRIDMVFRRFYRGEDSKGIGLGLAIVKELADVMGGRIELKSSVGKGTIFRIWIPVKNI
jgi:two-component system sensor histidine kinase BaeS